MRNLKTICPNTKTNSLMLLDTCFTDQIIGFMKRSKLHLNNLFCCLTNQLFNVKII